MTSEKLKQYISDNLDIAARYKSGIELDGCVDQAEYLWLKNGLFFTFFLDTFPRMGNMGPPMTSVHIDQLGYWGFCPLVDEYNYQGEYQSECLSPDMAAHIIKMCEQHQYDIPTVANVTDYLKYTANATPSVYLILDENLKSNPTVIRSTIKGVYKECDRNCCHELQERRPRQWPVSSKAKYNRIALAYYQEHFPQVAAAIGLDKHLTPDYQWAFERFTRPARSSDNSIARDFSDLIAACEDRVRPGPDEYPIYDYPWGIREVDSVDELIEQFQFGNWSVRTGFVLGDLAFVDQVSGGNEWLALKLDGGEWKSFDTISFYAMLEHRGEDGCRDYIEHLMDTPWHDLKYPSEPEGPTMRM